MRRQLFIVATIGALAGLVAGTHAEDAAKNPASAVSDEPYLEQPIPELRFDGVPFEKVLDRLQTVTRTKLIVDWPKFEAAGYHRDAPIRLHLFDLPLWKVLELVLIDARSEDTRGTPLAFRVDDRDERTFHISTQEALEGKTVARLYDVRDLLDRFFPKVTGLDGSLIETDTPAGRTDDLIRLLTDSMTPPANFRPGTFGHMEAESGFLFVTQTPENQRSIELVLYNLRKIVATRKAGEKPTTRGIDLLAPPATEARKK